MNKATIQIKKIRPRLMPLATMLLCVVVLVVVQSAAADAQFCDRYAQTSVRQYDVALAEGMEDLQFPVWSNDYAYHHQWCLQSTEQLAWQSISDRDAKKKWHRNKPKAVALIQITGMRVATQTAGQVVFNVSYSNAAYKPELGVMTLGGWFYKDGNAFGGFTESAVMNPIGEGSVAISINSWDPKSSDEVRFWLYLGDQKLTERSFPFDIATGK